MTSMILRRSSSVISRRFFAALASVEPLPRRFPADRHGVSGDGARTFHAKPEPLNFRASPVPRAAQVAIERDYSNYEEVSSANSDEGLEIAKLGIAAEIVDALARKGIANLFPIQKAVLEPAMQGRDMIGRARTGTGKTLAFGIPILDRIIQFNAKHGQGRDPLALVLAPTRELARQVEKEFNETAPNLATICLYGGMPIQHQMRQLNYGVNIAVGTPGRIIDLLNRGALNLKNVKFVVLDEADQMLQVGFQEAVEKILEGLSPNRQTLMFSATMPSWIKNITYNYQLLECSSYGSPIMTESIFSSLLIVTQYVKFLWTIKVLPRRKSSSAGATCLSRCKTKKIHPFYYLPPFPHFHIRIQTRPNTTMAPRVSPPVALLLSLLTLLTLSRARDLPNLFSEPKPHSEPQTNHPEPKTVSFTIDTIDPVPLTLLRFRPINRHFQPGLPLPLSLRTGHRRCRHGRNRREIPYGNDAILVGDAAAASRIHPSRVRVHSAAETRFPATVERQDSDHDHEHDHEHHHQHHGERHHHHHHHRHEESWFAKKIRKFMNLF